MVVSKICSEFSVAATCGLGDDAFSAAEFVADRDRSWGWIAALLFCCLCRRVLAKDFS